ncbi:MAG: hypothetical protein JXP34_11445 [Planctomycetes bacterium]|nr:hypothetical protein [Planctomycetota bacterium]
MTSGAGPFDPAREDDPPADPRAILSEEELAALLAPVPAPEPARILVVCAADEWPSFALPLERLGARPVREGVWQRALDRLRREQPDLVVGTARALAGAREIFVRRARESPGRPIVLLALPRSAVPDADGVVGLPLDAAEFARWMAAPRNRT